MARALVSIAGKSAKNKFINSKFDFWQRGASFNFGDLYTADRWVYTSSGGGGTVATGTVSRQILDASVFEDQEYYLRMNNTNQGTSLGTSSFHGLIQRVEDVRTFAGKTITLSVWASSSIVGKQIALIAGQNFGSGGSPGTPLASSVVTLTSTVTRYDATFTVPSIAGKAIGSNNHLFLGVLLQNGSAVAAQYSIPTISWGGTGNVDIVRVMVTEGTLPVTFETAGQGHAEELTLCQRYYEKSYNIDVAPGTAGDGRGSARFYAGGSNNIGTLGGVRMRVVYKVQKRAMPNSITVYSWATGAAGVIRYSGGAPAASDVAALSAEDSGTHSCTIGSNVGTNNTDAGAQWVVDAEI